MNGYCAAVLWPAPCQVHDSRVIYEVRNPQTSKKNYHELNQLFENRDTAVADMAFAMFSQDGSKPQLLRSAVITRIRKPDNEDFPPITKALNDQLSQDRNGVEHSFGWLKNRFENISGGKHKHVHNGKCRWVYSIVANEFALHNIHCFEELMVAKNLIKEIDQDQLEDHDFFKTDPVHDVTEDGDDGDLVDVLLQEGNANETEQNMIDFLNERNELIRNYATEQNIAMQNVRNTVGTNSDEEDTEDNAPQASINEDSVHDQDGGVSQTNNDETMSVQETPQKQLKRKVTQEEEYQQIAESNEFGRGKRAKQKHNYATINKT